MEKTVYCSIRSSRKGRHHCFFFFISKRDFALKGPKLKKNGPKLNFEFQKSLLVNQRTMFCRLSMYLQYAPKMNDICAVKVFSFCT